MKKYLISIIILIFVLFPIIYWILWAHGFCVEKSKNEKRTVKVYKIPFSKNPLYIFVGDSASYYFKISLIEGQKKFTSDKYTWESNVPQNIKIIWNNLNSFYVTFGDKFGDWTVVDCYFKNSNFISCKRRS